jgi:hypothetical protein
MPATSQRRYQGLTFRNAGEWEKLVYSPMGFGSSRDQASKISSCGVQDHQKILQPSRCPRVLDPSIIKSRQRSILQAPEDAPVERLVLISHPGRDVDEFSPLPRRISFDTFLTMGTGYISEEAFFGTVVRLGHPSKNWFGDHFVGTSRNLVANHQTMGADLGREVFPEFHLALRR